ncbi:MAG: ABC transporter ATP-binding protein [Pseudomonadota bacterium]
MIDMQHVNRVFSVGTQQVHALRDINLTVEPGAYISIMGPSGSGKSTLLNLIGLLDRPSDGRYLLDGRETTTLDDEEQARMRRDELGFVFQFFHLVPRLTAVENIELPMMLSGVAPEERRQRAMESLADYGIADRADHRPDQLSGGQRQRVAIARATVMRPKIILADEPTGNLDRSSGAEVIHILERLNRDGITLIVVTHDPEIGQRAREQIRIVDGSIVEHIRRDQRP